MEFELDNAGSIHYRPICLFTQCKWISHVSQFTIGIRVLVKLNDNDITSHESCVRGRIWFAFYITNNAILISKTETLLRIMIKRNQGLWSRKWLLEQEISEWHTHTHTHTTHTTHTHTPHTPETVVFPLLLFHCHGLFKWWTQASLYQTLILPDTHFLSLLSLHDCPLTYINMIYKLTGSVNCKQSC